MDMGAHVDPDTATARLPDGQTLSYAERRPW